MRNSYRLSAKARMIIGFSIIVLSIVVMLAVSLSSIYRIINIQRDQDQIADTAREITQLRAYENLMSALLLEYMMADSEAVRGDILMQIEFNIDMMNQREELIGEKLSELPDFYGFYQDIKTRLDAYEVSQNELIDLIGSGREQEAFVFYQQELKPEYDDIRTLTYELELKMDDFLDEIVEDGVSMIIRSQSTMFIFGILTMVVSVVIVIVLFRVINKISFELKEGITVLGESSAEIQTTVSEVSASAAETASSISETTTTVEEVRQTSSVSGKKAHIMMENAQKAAEISEQGLESSQLMVDGMNQINKQMQLIHQTISKLSDQNRSIGEITTTVSDIADQSNLLAVNAAIEAAKAGEHGRGFSVVALEIRSLSEQSKKSTVQVKEILSEIQNSIQKTVDAIATGSGTVEEGIRLVAEDRRVVEMLTETVEESMQASIQISSSSQQQITGMEQIVPAMENIKQASDQNTEAIRQVKQAADELNELGRKLKQIIDNYRL